MKRITRFCAALFCLTNPNKFDWIRLNRKVTLMAAGLVAVMSFSSCEINIGTSQEVSVDAFLTAYYVGGLPTATTQGRYELRSQYLSDREIEDIFYELSAILQPGFTEATLEIEFYDWMDNYKFTRIFDFWWEYYDYVTGDGYYAWQERE